MVMTPRIFIGLAIWLAGTCIAAAATVPTERVTAPRSMEPAPGISVPEDELDIDKALPGDGTETGEDKPDSGQEPKESAEPEEPAAPLPQIHYGEDGLPAAVKQMRADLLQAAKAADFDRLRLIYDANEAPPTLSFGETGDPIDFLKQSSGDPDGYEILAIMIEVLQAGWVHKNPGQPNEMYVWPYFAEIPLHHLSPAQKVELYKIVTSTDFEEMENFGSYIFYRLGIGADGTWYYFVAGD